MVYSGGIVFAFVERRAPPARQVDQVISGEGEQPCTEISPTKMVPLLRPHLRPDILMDVVEVARRNPSRQPSKERSRMFVEEPEKFASIVRLLVRNAWTGRHVHVTYCHRTNLPSDARRPHGRIPRADFVAIRPRGGQLVEILRRSSVPAFGLSGPVGKTSDRNQSFRPVEKSMNKPFFPAGAP